MSHIVLLCHSSELTPGYLIWIYSSRTSLSCTMWDVLPQHLVGDSIVVFTVQHYHPFFFFFTTSLLVNREQESCILFFILWYMKGGSDGKDSAFTVGDPCLISGLGRCPGEGNGNPLQYSCLENSRHWGSWWAMVHGVAKSRTWFRLRD